VLGFRKIQLWLASAFSAIAALLLLAHTANAQLSGRIFPYKWAGPVPAEDITVADVQHALIWTRHYGAMVDGVFGPYSQRNTDCGSTRVIPRRSFHRRQLGNQGWQTHSSPQSSLPVLVPLIAITPTF